MTSLARARAAAVAAAARLPLIVKVGLPVVAVSTASAALLENATTAELLDQCARLTSAQAVCADQSAINAVGQTVALLAADVTAVTLVALWLVFHTFVQRPVGALAAAAARVADGDLETRLGVPAFPGVRDELLRVSAEFDRMVSAVGQNERRIRSIIDTAYDAFVSADSAGLVTDWSAQAEALFGWTREEAVGAELAELIVPVTYRSRHREGLSRLARSGEGRVIGHPLELPALRRDGTEIPVELVIWTTEVEGERRFHSFIRDISERKRLQAQLTHQAFHDPLTGLANRALFADRLQHALQRPGAGVGVVFCDLDDFKTVNDSLGHAAGDRLLLVVAERLSDALRPSDTLARLAGDEFAVLVEDSDDEEVAQVAARMHAALASAVELDGREVIARASIGVATATDLEGPAGFLTWRRTTDPEAETLAEALLRNADAAMYAAKARGKDTIERFTADMHQRAVDRLTLRAELHAALLDGQLALEYQPYVNAETGRITGCEALVRWHHPTRGLVSPVQFIPLAEETGLIRELGLWVLRQACLQMQQWDREVGLAGPFTMSVNVSVRQLESPDFVQQVADVLAGTGTDPSRLVLEVTESVLSDDHRGVLERLEQLKALGLRIALDDFGTGYSSLARLRHVPVDVVKIDRSFVTPLDHASAADASVITAILQIGASRNLSTVAEGVETVRQLDALRSLGCDTIQGFLFHRPMAPELVTRQLREETLVPKQRLA